MAGGQAYDSKSAHPTIRIFQPKDAILFKVKNGGFGVNAAQFARFAIPTPSNRMNVSVKLFWWPNVSGQSATLLSPPDNPIDIFQQLQFGGTPGQATWALNLYTAEQAETGWLVPTGDLVGTLAGASGISGQIVPLAGGGVNLGQAGFSLDVQGGQDWICGLLLIPNTTGVVLASLTGLNISLRVRYEVNSTEMCEDEWQRLTSKLQIQTSPTVVFT